MIHTRILRMVNRFWARVSSEYRRIHDLRLLEGGRAKISIF